VHGAEPYRYYKKFHHWHLEDNTGIIAVHQLLDVTHRCSEIEKSQQGNHERHKN
jgi:hypothetical protein